MDIIPVLKGLSAKVPGEGRHEGACHNAITPQCKAPQEGTPYLRLRSAVQRQPCLCWRSWSRVAQQAPGQPQQAVLSHLPHPNPPWAATECCHGQRKGDTGSSVTQQLLPGALQVLGMQQLSHHLPACCWHRRVLWED